MLPYPPPLADTVPATVMLPLLSSRQLPVHAMVELLSTENKALAFKTPRVVDTLLPEKVRLDAATMASVMTMALLEKDRLDVTMTAALVMERVDPVMTASSEILTEAAEPRSMVQLAMRT